MEKTISNADLLKLNDVLSIDPFFYGHEVEISTTDKESTKKYEARMSERIALMDTIINVKTAAKDMVTKRKEEFNRLHTEAFKALNQKIAALQGTDNSLLTAENRNDIAEYTKQNTEIETKKSAFMEKITEGSSKVKIETISKAFCAELFLTTGQNVGITQEGRLMVFKYLAK